MQIISQVTYASLSAGSLMKHLLRAVRDFNVHRILSVASTPVTYTVPADFDLADYLGEGWGIMCNTGDPEAGVILRFSPRVGRWMREERWHTTQQVTDEPDGHTRFALRIPLPRISAAGSSTTAPKSKSSPLGRYANEVGRGRKSRGTVSRGKERYRCRTMSAMEQGNSSGRRREHRRQFCGTGD